MSVPLADTASASGQTAPPAKAATITSGYAVPTRHFDAYAVLSIFKTIGDFVALVAISQNNFDAGLVVGAIGLGVAILLRFICNNMMTIELKNSGVVTEPFSFTALVNTLFGTRYGYLGHYERLSEEIRGNNVAGDEAVVDGEGHIKAPSPALIGGSETVKVGPRTLTAMAEVIQQGFMFYPILILFLQFGFDGNVELAEVLIGCALLSLAQIMCWLISPSLNASYGYVFLATWIAFTAPFLLVLLLSVSFDDEIQDSYYTRKEIYAWTKFAIVLTFGVVGLSVYNSSMHRLLERNISYPSAMPALLYFMSSFSIAFLLFEVVSLGILLANEEAFLFNDEDVEEDTSRLSAIVLANTTFAGWTLVVSYVEQVSFRTELR